ncbi:MAG: hypothetical protein ACREGJ_01005 [Candidatus Saccharimonadales bacterium]
MSTAEKLGALPGFGWMVNLHPLVGILFIVGLTHGGMWVIMMLEEGFIVRSVIWRWARGYQAWLYGDVALALAFGLALVGVRSLPSSTDRLYQNVWVHVGILALWLLVGAWRWSFNDYNAYTVEQSASPSKLYHDLLFPLIGYLLSAALVPLLAPTNWWRGHAVQGIATMLCIVFIGLWVWFGIGDQRDSWKAEHAHPKDFTWPVSRLVGKYIDPLLRKP